MPLHEEIVETVCERIKEVYAPEEIIVHKHFFARQYTEGEKLYTYLRISPVLSDKVEQILSRLYDKIIELLPGCHVIDFPENVLGDKLHCLGCMPLHYHKLYYEYGEKALQIIFEKHGDEEFLLSQLCDMYSMKFRLLRLEIEMKSRQNLNNSRFENMIYALHCIRTDETDHLYERLKKCTDITSYLDLLWMLRDRIVVFVAVKDTPGGRMPVQILESFRRYGFTRYLTKLWYMYNGIVYKGDILVNKVGEVAEQAVQTSICLGEETVVLGSFSYRKGNSAQIIIDEIDYAVNSRGINLVVYDPQTKGVIDSVCYDSFDIQDQFLRKKN